jgi:integrase
MRKKAVPNLRAAAEAALDNTSRPDLTFGELCRAFLAGRLDGSDCQLRKWSEQFGDMNAWAITKEQLDAAGTALIAAGFKESTVNRNMASLGSVYRWAKKRGLPPRGFASPTLALIRYEETPKAVFLTDKELEALLDACLGVKDRRFEALIRLLAETGARRGEVLDRLWGECDLDRREIAVGRTKTGTARILHFSEATATLMRRAWQEPEREPGMLMFASRRRPGQPIEFKRHWRYVTATIGRPDLRLHDLRHHRAKKLIASGVPIAVASQALGHSSLILHRRYGHLDNSHLKQAVETSWG